MPSTGHLTLGKKERLTGKSLVESLFKGGGSRSLSFFPLRAVYAFVEDGDVPVRLWVSVPKRCFKRAVKRNRIKRQLREAYRLQKEILQSLEGGLDIAFLWTSDEVLPTEKVFQKMRSLLLRICESEAGKRNLSD